MKSIKLKFGRWRESCWRFRTWRISISHKRRFKSKNYLAALFYSNPHFIQASQFNYPNIQIPNFPGNPFSVDFLFHYFLNQLFFISSIFNKNQSFKIRRQYVF